MILLGISSFAVPPSLISQLSFILNDNSLVGIGMSIIMMGQNIGMFIGPI